MLGQRILVIGCCGSGKTTLALKLGSITDTGDPSGQALLAAGLGLYMGRDYPPNKILR
jgi:hypothetical protein